MRTLIIALALQIIFAGAAWAAPCNGVAERQLKFSSAEKPDTFVVESFGADCRSARLVIYVKSERGGWDALLIGLLSDYGEAASAAALPGVLKEIADRIEGPMMSTIDTWAEIQRAATQPEGNPWRGTPLVQAEYERILRQKPRYVFLPTDAVRAKMIVWDEHGVAGQGRPVDFIYYGD